jgi:hypothetical protein
MIPIPYGMQYTSTASGRVPKVVECEACHQKYAYFLERTVTGEATSFLFLENAEAKQRAQEEARIELLGTLARSCDPVPCPHCGWYQREMVLLAKDRHRTWAKTTGLAAILLAIPFSVAGALARWTAEQRPSETVDLIGDVATPFAAACALIGPLLLVWRNRSRTRFDPNDAPVEHRIAEGRARAMTVERFGEQLAACEESQSRRQPDDMDPAPLTTPATPDLSPGI